LNDGVSGALTGGGPLSDIGVACAVLAGFALVLGAVALKTFRWSDKS
nr:ABC transporter permease [Streptomyces sp. DSM 41633]